MDESILKSLSSCNGQTNQQMLAYFEYLKTNPDGWKTCIEALLNDNYRNDDQIYFFLLQILEFYLKTNYKSSSFEEHSAIKDFLLRWLQNLSITDETRSFILNKYSQLFCLACLIDFPTRWPSFFHDLLASLNIGVNHRMQVCLKILQSIDEEVVDREVPHTEEELKRNTMIKDMMREQCISTLVASWYDILVCYSAQPQNNITSSILTECLKVVGCYISWIDLSLIANDKFIQIILRLMGGEGGCFSVQSAACDCLGEVVVKGMDAAVKVQLVQTMASVIHTSGILVHFEKLQKNDEDDEEENEFLESLAGLLSNMGLQLILSWNKFYKAKDIENAKMTSEAIESKLIPLLKILEADDITISGITIPFINSYISMLKLQPPSSQTNLFVKELLRILHKKMQYPSDYNFLHEDGDDEMEWQGYRKDLKVIFVNLHPIEPDVFLESVRELVMMLIGAPINQSQPFQPLEASIYFLFLLGEVMPLSGQSGKIGNIPEHRLNTLYSMLAQLINSNVSHYSHPVVQLQYFETISRFEKFFSLHTQHIHNVLVSFLDERGLWNSKSSVRSRCAYLFSKFVKSINKTHLQSDLEMLLGRLSSLLILNTDFKAPPAHNSQIASFNHHPHPASSTVSSSHSSHHRSVIQDDDDTPHLSVEDQQFMFETAGILIIQSQFPPQKKQDLMSTLVVPLLRQFEQINLQLNTTPDTQQQLFLIQLMCQAISFVSRASKGFSGQQTLRANECVDVFTNAMRVFLAALQVPKHLQAPLHQAFRQFLHRMVICLEDEMTSFIHPCIEHLMTDASIKQLTDFIPFLNQLILKFKKQMVPCMQPIFIPIVSTIQNALALHVDDNDNVTKDEKTMLLRAYFGYLNAVLSNDTSEILTSQDDSSVKVVVEGVLVGCTNAEDPPTQKLCFLIIKKLIEISDKVVTQEMLVPCCFQAPLHSSFDLNDAQTLLTLNEISSCLYKFHQKHKKDFLLFLSSIYLPSINLNQVIAMQLCEKLETSTEKDFQNTMKVFFTQMRSAR